MSKRDRLRDPKYAPIVFRIESLIHSFVDRFEQRQSARIKDSDIKSAIRKALTALKKGSAISEPNSEETDPREALAFMLLRGFEEDGELNRLESRDLMTSLLSVEESLKVRREMAGHSRGYIEFLSDFIGEIQARDTRKTTGTQDAVNPT